MPDLINLDGKSINSAEEFFNYKELLTTKALAIISPTLEIVYCNNLFKNLFHLNVKDNLNKLHPHSEFLVFIKSFLDSKYQNLTSDLYIPVSQKITDVENYQVSVERILILSKQYLLITLESLEYRKVIEKKIDSLHHALDYGKVPIIIIDNQKKIIYATSSFEEIFSRGLDSLYNLEISELIKEYIDERELDFFLQCLNKGTIWKKLVEIKKHGENYYWEFILQPFTTIDSYETNFVLSANNLTDYIYQKKLIEESDKKQKLIIENISDLLLILKSINNGFYFENANDNFCKLFNLDKSKLYLHEINDYLPPQLFNLIKENIRLLEENNNIFQQFTYNHSSGQHFTCKITSTNINGSDSKIYIITLKDVTDEIHYREQLEKNYLKEIQLNKMKSAFIANISHEIRTPFNGIIGYSEIIDDCLAAKDYVAIKELMDSVKEVLGRVLNAFTNIVELAQIESDEVELEMVILNCNQVLKQVYDKRLSDAEKKNLTFKLEFSEQEAYIEIDWIKLEKIVDLLVDNAIKYTNYGYVYLGSKVYDDKVEIKIADTGIGIDSSQIERILMPFSQEIEGYTRPYEGVGLGLTIAYKLTKLMGGDLIINSEKNKGTEVLVLFPRKSV